MELKPSRMYCLLLRQSNLRRMRLSQKIAEVDKRTTWRSPSIQSLLWRGVLCGLSPAFAFEAQLNDWILQGPLRFADQ